MPGLDRVIDPITRDYVDDDNGGFAETPTIETSVYHQAMGHLGQWAGDAAAGSRFYTLQRENADHATMLRAKDILREAYQPLVDAGLATELTVDTDRDALNRLVVKATARDAQFGELKPMPLTPGGV